MAIIAAQIASDRKLSIDNPTAHVSFIAGDFNFQRQGEPTTHVIKASNVFAPPGHEMNLSSKRFCSILKHHVEIAQPHHTHYHEQKK